MPILLGKKIRRLNQTDFGEIAYEVMRWAFQVHCDLGRCFEEKIYQRALAFHLPNAQTEVPIDLVFEDFGKTYYIDLLVESGAVFELKAVESLTSRHRGQLLNYLLLSDAAHGKLLNFHGERVQHEFVNNMSRLAERTGFAVDDHRWEEIDGQRLKEWIVALLRDWGVSLDLALYEEAVSHFCGRCDHPYRDIEILSGSRSLGVQHVQLAAPDIAVRITAWPAEDGDVFEAHLRRFLEHTRLRALQWINVTPRLVQFTTLRA